MGASGTPNTGRTGAGRREQSDIYATILEVVKRYHGSARITRVSYGAGMPVDRLRGAIGRLTALGLLSQQEGDGVTTYSITARGQEFLNTYWRMKSYTELFGDGASPPLP
ncbi:MAG: winged helix-turn-helix domain-containing protein [Thermoplasmata archaeon]|nr:winged helix-turn-helix domain-containing protein [Thermoplasmata archaeon]